ncbi:MAG: translocation/assembly module TamB domain-containing protein, partial [Gemmatimonadota bacterium]
GDDDPSVRLAATIRNVLDDATGTDFEIEGTVLRSTERGPSLDLTVHTPSFALSALSAFVPGADALQGEVGGDVRLRGPADELQVDADLDTPGGPLELWATLDLTDSLSGYHVEARFTDYDPGRLLDRGPTMALTGTFDLAGAGDAFGEGRGAVRVSLDSGVVGSLPFDAALAELRFDDGLLRVDTLTAVRSGARLDAHGEFGLLAERSGRLDLTLRADSLGALRSDATRDPVLVPDDEGDGESPVDTVALAGAVELRGWLDGSIASFRAGADAEARELRYGSSAVARAAATLDARADGPEGADELRATLRLTGEGLRVGAGALDSADVTATLAPDGGTVEVDARGPADREYRLAGEFDRSADTTAITVDRFHIASPRGAWTLVRPVPVRLGPAALDIDDARLARSDGAARLAMDGTLPAVLVPGDRLARERQPVDFRVTAEDVPIGEVLHLAQLDTAAAGTLHGGVTVRGTAGDPRIAGETRVEGLRLDSLTVRSATTSFDYASRRLEARLAVEQDDRRILDGTGSIPLDLALLPVEERRLDEPLEFAVRADRVPAALIASLIPGAAAVEGEIDGELSVGGTARDPVLAGELAVDRAAATWTPTGIRYRDVSGTFRVLGERLVGVRLSARAAQGDGSAQLEGTITVPSLDDPNFDLALVMRDFPAVRRPEVDAVASGRIQLAGRYRRPVVTGRISVTRGALHLDRIVRNRRVVELEDPLLPAVLDSGGVAVDQVVPVAERSPFLQNLVLEDATVAVSSDFWLRGRNMNVELVGDLNVTYDRRGEDLRLSGILNAVRGSYQLRVTNVYTRRFTVNEGTVEFVGTPEMDPNLDLTGEYRVRTRGGSPLDIFVQVSGTLREPRIRLTSDAEPPISESELVSY